MSLSEEGTTPSSSAQKGGRLRLSLLVEKLGHPLKEIRLRSLRNLRLKLSNQLLGEAFWSEEATLYQKVLAMLRRCSSCPTCAGEAIRRRNEGEGE